MCLLRYEGGELSTRLVVETKANDIETLEAKQEEVKQAANRLDKLQEELLKQVGKISRAISTASALRPLRFGSSLLIQSLARLELYVAKCMRMPIY